MDAAEHATLSEADLLTLVNVRIPHPIQERYSELIERRRAESLKTEEYQELLQLTNQIEQFEAHRVEYLAALARLRQVPISQLLTDLGIDGYGQYG